jgi:D-alanyl-lipoteichoic acid acyltransferase DltB (MBOAT superfamily)
MPTMLFNSFGFIFAFLPLALIGYYGLTTVGPRVSALWLIVISFVFYGWWNPRFLILFAASILFNYAASEAIARVPARPRLQTGLLALAIAVDVGALVYYKYLDAIIGFLTGLGVLHGTVSRIALPLGISFFTFTQIGYLVDKKEGLVSEKGFFYYVLFVSFFPHLIAGPILHNGEIIPQLSQARTYRFSAENLSVGIALFAFGLVKKTLFADSMIDQVRAGFDHAHGASFDAAWIAVLSYALQIYFDFSGYSDMAIGLARMFNIRFPMNFNSPYKAASIIELWQRWHMTLSRYLALYVYNPLALAITRGRASRDMAIGRAAQATAGGFAAMVVFPTIVTMAIAGLWHGAGLQYLVFGVIHGLYLSINHAMRILRPHRATATGGRLRYPAKVLITFAATLFALVFFRSSSVSAAIQLLGGMTGLHGFDPVALPHALLPHLGPDGLALVNRGMIRGIPATDFINDASQLLWLAGLFVIVWFFPNTQQIMRHFEPTLDTIQAGPFAAHLAWRPNIVWAAAVGGALCLGVLAIGGTSEFLYFQF